MIPILSPIEIDFRIDVISKNNMKNTFHHLSFSTERSDWIIVRDTGTDQNDTIKSSFPYWLINHNNASRFCDSNSIMLKSDFRMKVISKNEMKNTIHQLSFFNKKIWLNNCGMEYNRYKTIKLSFLY